MRTAHLIFGQTQLKQNAAWFFQVHRHAFVDRIDLADGADQQRRRDGNSFVVVSCVYKLVLQAVFTGDKRRLVDHRHIATGNRRSCQASKHFGSVGIPPAEVIQHSNSIWIGANRDAVADRFVNSTCRHVVRVKVPEVRIHAARHHNAAT